MRDERGTSNLVPAIKKIGEKETSLLRWKLAVVEPHSSRGSEPMDAGKRCRVIGRGVVGPRGPEVRRLIPGGRWIRTIGPQLR